MNDQDILEGRLIVEIGMAAVRPAEFIILRFLTSCRRRDATVSLVLAGHRARSCVISAAGTARQPLVFSPAHSGEKPASDRFRRGAQRLQCS